jgi:uncharacterized membrane protein HdeD (DUF308 family)
MQINHAPLWMGVLWIIIGAFCFGVGIISGAHVLTVLGMIILPAGIMYSLLAGHPKRETPYS